MNNDVGLDEELSRMLRVFESKTVRQKLKNKVVSVDTFRPEVIFEVRNILSKVKPRKIIWNDVSGVIDDNVFNWLENEGVEYVFSHNLAQNRSETCKHMKYVFEGALSMFWKDFVEYFDSGLNKLKKFEKLVYLDPCFGFSKSYEQNLFLLSKFKDFQHSTPEESRFLWGSLGKASSKKIWEK